MALPAGWTVEEVEETPVPRKASKLPEGWEEEGGGEDGLEGAPPAGKPEIHDSVSTFGLNALDSLSVVGVPSVLAMKDAVFGEESAKASKNTEDDDPEFSTKGLIDRYRQNKKFYREGMGRAADESPGAAIAGQLTAALIPGPKGVGVLKRAASTGGLHGLLGGSADTLGGDLQGAIVDAGVGTGGALVGEAIGSAAGKGIKYLGDVAARRLGNARTEKIASILGKLGQRKKDAVAAVKNLNIQEALESAPEEAVDLGVTRAGRGQLAKGKSPVGQLRDKLRSEFPDAEKDLYDASAGNASKEVRRFVGAQKRFGTKSGMPTKERVGEIADRMLESAGDKGLRDTTKALTRIVGGAVVGNYTLQGLGFSPAESKAIGATLAGGGPLYALRKTGAALTKHPRILQALATRLPALGKRMANKGGDLGTVAGYVTALLGTDAGRRAANEAVQSVADETVDPETADGISAEGAPAPQLIPSEDEGVRPELIPSERQREFPRRRTGGSL